MRIATVDIAEAKPKALRVSSLVAVRRSEKVPEAAARPGQPALRRRAAADPSMGEPFSKAPTKELPFYFVVYPAKDGTPTATLSLLSAGKPLAEVPLELARGRRQGPDSAGQPDPARRAPARDLRAARRR